LTNEAAGLARWITSRRVEAFVYAKPKRVSCVHRARSDRGSRHLLRNWGVRAGVNGACHGQRGQTLLAAGQAPVELKLRPRADTALLPPMLKFSIPFVVDGEAGQLPIIAISPIFYLARCVVRYAGAYGDEDSTNNTAGQMIENLFFRVDSGWMMSTWWIHRRFRGTSLI